MDLDQLKKSFRTVSDFPKKGITFRDITTVVKNPECMNFIILNRKKEANENWN